MLMSYTIPGYGYRAKNFLGRFFFRPKQNTSTTFCYRPSLEIGSDQLIVTLYTLSIPIPADPNPFRGTHCTKEGYTAYRPQCDVNCPRASISNSRKINVDILNPDLCIHLTTSDLDGFSL